MLFCVTASAQHITFLGIQLGQTEATTDKLIRLKGFNYVGRAYEPANIYEGAFWIYKNSNLLARTYKGKVTEIIVTPNSYQYNQEADFYTLVKNLNKKYGKYCATTNNGLILTYIWKIKGGCIEASKAGRTSKISLSIRYIDYSSIYYKNPKDSYNRNRNNDL